MSQPPPLPTNHRLLVVDDNPDALLVLRMLLEIKGYLVEACSSGKQALILADQDPPQAILLDISMPELDGYETCRRLRQQAWGQHVIVIALTGYGQEADRQRSRDAGFDGHLVKPVDIDELTSLLTHLLSLDGTNR